VPPACQADFGGGWEAGDVALRPVMIAGDSKRAAERQPTQLALARCPRAYSPGPAWPGHSGGLLVLWR
jgi:hypothetical protein